MSEDCVLLIYYLYVLIVVTVACVMIDVLYMYTSII
jgi:hypothetical protein